MLISAYLSNFPALLKRTVSVHSGILNTLPVNTQTALKQSFHFKLIAFLNVGFMDCNRFLRCVSSQMLDAWIVAHLEGWFLVLCLFFPLSLSLLSLGWLLVSNNFMAGWTPNFPVMVHSLCQLGWATVPKYLAKHFSAHSIRVFLDEINIYIDKRWIKQIPQCGWASSTQLNTLIEHLNRSVLQDWPPLGKEESRRQMVFWPESRFSSSLHQQLAGLPADFGFASLYNHERWIPYNKSLCTCTHPIKFLGSIVTRTCPLSLSQWDIIMALQGCCCVTGTFS